MFQKLLESKRFWLAIAGFLAVILRDQLGLPITEEQIQAIVLVIAAWIVGDSIRATDPAKDPLLKAMREAESEQPPD